MRLYGLKLTNYIGIYNGMGLNEIFIDFSKCKHLITIIKGDNGSGKSTIFKAMNPLSDPLSSLIPGKEASKIISYQIDDGDIISIQYVYPVNKEGKHVGTKCYITKKSSNGTVDLNPNGNVSDGKDMICSLFDFDQNFMTLSQLSSEDRGLADKKPAERKKFINNIMDSLSAYNEIYKKLSKKSSALKSTITSINAKIGSIGNKDMITNRIKTLKETMGDIEDRKALLLAEMGADKARLEIKTTNKDIENVEQYKIELMQLEPKLKSSYKYSKEDESLEESTNKIKNELEKKQLLMQEYDKSIKDINERIFSINDEIETKTVKLEYYNSNESIDEISKNIEDNTNKLSDIENRLNSFNDIARDISDYECETAKRIIYNINTALSSDIPERIKVAEMIKSSQPINIHKYDNDIVTLKQEIAKQEALVTYYNSLDDSTNDSVPNDCNMKTTCPLAKKVNEKHNAKKNITIAKDKITHLKEEIHNLESKTSLLVTLNNTANIFRNMADQLDSNKGLFAKFGISIDDMPKLDVFAYSTSLPLSFSDYEEFRNMMSLKASLSMQLDTLKNQYDQLSKNEEICKLLKNDLDMLHIKKDKLKNDPLFAKYTKLKQEIDDMTIAYNGYAEILTQYKIWVRIHELKNKLDNLSKDYEAVKEIKHRLTLIKDELDDIMINKYPAVKDEIEKLKYKVVLYNDYIEEYKKFSNKYNIVETVKKYASPSTGIQTVFMEMYMNDIITISNQLLSLLFNGEYVLHPFIINENEFKIPCSGKGILNDDITSMSTSQICMISMIISFALLHKSSSIYNIIKLDEMDGGLDSQNRIQFILLLQKMMVMLNAQQCIMISHNSELDMANADVIILRNSDPSLKINGNVIFQL